MQKMSNEELWDLQKETSFPLVRRLAMELLDARADHAGCEGKINAAVTERKGREGDYRWEETKLLAMMAAVLANSGWTEATSVIAAVNILAAIEQMGKK